MFPREMMVWRQPHARQVLLLGHSFVPADFSAAGLSCAVIEAVCATDVNIDCCDCISHFIYTSRDTCMRLLLAEAVPLLEAAASPCR